MPYFVPDHRYEFQGLTFQARCEQLWLHIQAMIEEGSITQQEGELFYETGIKVMRMKGWK